VGKLNKYKEDLDNLKDWDAYLLKNSNLPSPRSNLELLAVAVELGTKPTFLRYIKIKPEEAPANHPGEFLCTIGVAGLGKVILEERSNNELFNKLKDFAHDPRWRVREGVAMALQYIGKKDMEFLLTATKDWIESDLFIQRALVAGLCEPAILKNPAQAERVLELVFYIASKIKTHTLLRKTEAFRVLKKALSYGISVAMVYAPEKGKENFEVFMSESDPDLRSILKENLSKKRLSTMDTSWVNKTLKQF